MRDMNCDYPIADLATRVRSLGSRSPTPIPSRTAYSRSVSVSRSPKIASWESSSIRGRHGLGSSQERRTHRSPPPSLLYQRKRYDSQRSVSRGRRKCVDHGRGKLDVTEERYKTSFLDSHRGSNVGNISPVSRCNSINRTIVSVVISPQRYSSKTGHASKSRSRSRSRCGTPMPSSPTSASGYRTLLSDRDIQELLMARLAQKPNVGSKRYTMDSAVSELPFKRIKLPNARYENGYVTGTEYLSASQENATPETEGDAPRYELNRPNTSRVQPSPRHSPRETSTEPAASIVKPSDWPPNERCPETTQEKGVESFQDETSRKRLPASTEICTERTKLDDSIMMAGQELNVAFVPDMSRPACSACINSQCRCIHLTLGDGNCERCNMHNLQCAVLAMPELAQQAARVAACSRGSDKNEELGRLSTSSSRTRAPRDCQSYNVPVAARLKGPVAFPLSQPPEGTAHLSMDSCSPCADTWPITPFHARLQSQKGYEWVRDWSVVQPQRIHPERRRDLHQMVPQPPRKHYSTGAMRTVLVDPIPRRPMTPAGGDLAPQYFPGLNQHQQPPPHVKPSIQQSNAQGFHARQLPAQQDQSHQPQLARSTNLVPCYSGWPPQARPRHLPQPQSQAQNPRQWQSSPTPVDLTVEERAPMPIVTQQKQGTVPGMRNAATKSAMPIPRRHWKDGKGGS